MIDLFEQDVKTNDRHSSKGNQLKWTTGGYWYKTDYTGYEGLSEFVVSHLLEKSTLKKNEFIIYDFEQIKHKRQIYNGVKSKDFLKDGSQIITLERLFKVYHNMSLYESLWKIGDVKERFEFLCNQVKKITGLADFEDYLNKLFTIDAFFLNEDRHMHNIAVLLNEDNTYEYCPIYDNGASLLSDTSMDYPLNGDLYEMIKECKAKTISEDFDEQLDISEAFVKNEIKFYFTKSDVKKIIEEVEFYPENIKSRVEQIILYQMDKYKYLFGKAENK